MSPHLFFGAADVPALRARCRSAAHAPVFRKLIERAERMLDAHSREFADPAHIGAGYEDRPSHTRAAFFGRRFTSWMETFGFAWQMTGERRFLDRGLVLLNAALDMPVTNEWMAAVLPGGRGDMMRGLALGLDWLAGDAPKEQRAAIEREAVAYIENIMNGVKNAWWKPFHNYMGVAVGAAGFLALAVDAISEEQRHAWTAEAARMVSLWFDEGFDGEGAYAEGVYYSGYGLSNAIPFADALLRVGGANLFAHPHLRKVPQYLALSLLPGEHVYDARNDSNYDGYTGSSLLRLASAWNDGLSKWLWAETVTGKDDPFTIIWDNAVKPVPPAAAGIPKAKHFPGMGLVVARTGWEKDDTMFSLQANRYHMVTHDQADKGHFTLYGWGGRWAADGGYGNSREPGTRSTSYIHSLVLVNGRGQAAAGAALGTDSTITAYRETPAAVHVSADIADAYRRMKTHMEREADQIRQTKAPGKYGDEWFHFGIPMAHAYRHAIFVKPAGATPAYVLLCDDIAVDETAQEFTWQQVCYEDMAIDLTADGAVIHSTTPTTKARLQVTLTAVAPVTFSKDVLTINDNRKPANYPRLRGTVRSANPRFIAVLTLLGPEMKAPVVRSERAPSGARIEVAWPERRDSFAWDAAVGAAPTQMG